MVIKVTPTCEIEFGRKVGETLWYAIMLYYDVKNEKYVDSTVFGDNPDYVIDTPTFCVRAYNWHEPDDANYKDTNDLFNHNNEWHFWHKPSGFKIQWYKYPLRDAYSNMQISHEQFWDILYDCQNHLHPQFTHMIDKWWEETFFYTNDMVVPLAGPDGIQVVTDKKFNCCNLKNGDMYIHRINEGWELSLCGVVEHAKVFPQTLWGYIDRKRGIDAKDCIKVVSLLCGNKEEK